MSYELNSSYYPINETQPFDGIFNYLQTQTGYQNLTETHIVKLTTSSTLDGYPESNIFNKESNETVGFWASIGEEPNEWIQIDFIKNKIALTGYTISRYYWDFQKQFDVYGSDDGKKWSSIHRQKHLKQPDPSSQKLINIYHTKKPLFRRYIKFVQSGQRFNHGNNDNRFILHRIELFGILNVHKDLIHITPSISKFNINLWKLLFVCIFI